MSGHPHTPADVLASSLVAAAVGVRPSSVTAPVVPVWPVYVNHLPETPDNAIAVYDTGGLKDGRLMAAGTTIHHPGFQVRVRARDHQAAIVKIKAAQAAIDAIKEQTLELDGDSYTIAAATQTGDILPLGKEPEGKQRENFTINGTLTIRSS